MLENLLCNCLRWVPVQSSVGGYYNLGFIFLIIWNSQWCLHKILSKSDRLFITSSRVLQDYWWILDNNAMVDACTCIRIGSHIQVSSIPNWQLTLFSSTGNEFILLWTMWFESIENVVKISVIQACASSFLSEYHSCGQYVTIDKIRSESKVQPENISSPK